MTNTRLLRVAAVLTIVALVLPPFVLPALSQGGTIKIGMLAPLTGPFAQIGTPLLNMVLTTYP